MNFIEFTHNLGKNKIIDIQNVVTYCNGFDRRRLHEWQKKGYIKKIVNNLYIFSDTSIDGQVLNNLASLIYKPSYVALESALAFYNFIPDSVFQIKSLTTKRNKTVKTDFGEFKYRTIKKPLFFGYNTVKTELGSFYISDPEKTLLDIIYFTDNSAKKEVLTEFRFNYQEINKLINVKRVKNYKYLFASPKVSKAIDCLMEMANVKF